MAANKKPFGETSHSNKDENDDLIDRLYAVAVDPSRLQELIDFWGPRVESHMALDQDTPLISPAMEKHFSRADEVLSNITSADVTRESAIRSLERVASPAMVCERDGLIIGANVGAREKYSIKSNSRLDVLGLDSESQNALMAALSGVESDGDEAVLYRFRKADLASPLLVQISSFQAGEDYHSFVLLQTAEVVWHPKLSSTLAHSFDLTPIEIETARLLTEGHSLKEISSSRNRSIETVRTQLRSLLRKTQTGNQSEFVRVMLTMMELARSDTKSISTHLPIPTPVQTAVESLKLQPFYTRDRRRMDFTYLGSPAGKPALYIHGDLGFYLWTAPAVKRLTQLGIKLYVPTRAGFGLNSPPASAHKALDQYADDLLEFMDKFEIEQCPIVCEAASLRYNIRLASVAPERVSGIIGAAVHLPMFKSEHFKGMGGIQKFMHTSARYAPATLPFIARAGFMMARRQKKENFLNTIFADAPSDLKAAHVPEIREVILQGSDIGLNSSKSAHQAYSLDKFMTVEDWREELFACPVPIELFHGDDDPVCNFDLVKSYCDEMPNATLHLCKDAGRTLVLQEWKKIIDAIKAFQA